MAVKTQDTSILIQHLIALRAKRDIVMEKADALNIQLMEMDAQIQEGVDILLNAGIDEEKEEAEVVRIIQR